MDKKCTKCNEIKDISDFSIRKSRNQYNTHCNKCIAEKQAKIRFENKEKLEFQSKMRSEKAATIVHLIKNKICNECNVEKLIENFQFRKNRNVYEAKCKQCLAIKAQQKYQNVEKDKRKKERAEKKANKPKKIILDSKKCTKCCVKDSTVQE